MVINLNERQEDKKTKKQCLLVFLSSCLLVFFLLSSCSSIRPIAKIGLIASFEGISRRNGYEALAAMRAAIADSPATRVDLLPLALDDSRDPQRTAQKMLADPTLKAVIGPLVPQEMALTLQDFSKSEVRWVAPFVIEPQGGFAEAGQASAWATEMIRTIAQANHREGGKLYLLDWVPGWPHLSEQEWHTITAIDTQMTDSSTFMRGIMEGKIHENALIFWLGSAEDGARFVNQLWQVRPELAVWSGMQGGDPVFAERLQLHGPFFWATWSNEQYETWAATHTPASPAAYLTYLATRSAISQLQSLPDPSTEVAWTIKCFHLNQNGTSSDLIPCNTN